MMTLLEKTINESANAIVKRKEQLIKEALPSGTDLIKDCFMGQGSMQETLFLKGDPPKPIITFYKPKLKEIPIENNSSSSRTMITMEYKIYNDE